MFCTVCNTQMKPLLTSWYCPQDCDRKASDITTESRVFIQYGRDRYVLTYLPDNKYPTQGYNKYVWTGCDTDNIHNLPGMSYHEISSHISGTSVVAWCDMIRKNGCKIYQIVKEIL